MQQQFLTNWEFLILINLVERELKNSRRNRDKEIALIDLKKKLQQCSMGDMPFQIEVKI